LTHASRGVPVLQGATTAQGVGNAWAGLTLGGQRMDLEVIQMEVLDQDIPNAGDSL